MGCTDSNDKAVGEVSTACCWQSQKRGYLEVSFRREGNPPKQKLIPTERQEAVAAHASVKRNGETPGIAKSESTQPTLRCGKKATGRANEAACPTDFSAEAKQDCGRGHVST